VRKEKFLLDLGVAGRDNTYNVSKIFYYKYIIEIYYYNFKYLSNKT